MEIKKEPHTPNITLVIGENSSGKSLFSETLATQSDAPRIYLATMVSQNEENERRIEKHRIQRREKGFITIEQDWDIDKIDISPDSVVLLEDVSNLLANGIFIHHQTVDDAFSQIITLAGRCAQLIAVNIAGLSADGYDGETADYIGGINDLNDRLGATASCVYHMKDGKPIREK